MPAQLVTLDQVERMRVAQAETRKRNDARRLQMIDTLVADLSRNVVFEDLSDDGREWLLSCSPAAFSSFASRVLDAAKRREPLKKGK